MQLEGKVALVTGASRGIGRAVAVALGDAGCDIVVSYRASEDEAQEVVSRIASKGRRARSVQADLASPDSVARLAERALSALGGIDILVNNAGIDPRFPLDAITPDDWNQVLAINLTAPFLLTQLILPGHAGAAWGRDHHASVDRRADGRRDRTALRRQQSRTAPSRAA